MNSKIPGETHPVRRLLPDEAETTVAEQLAEILDAWFGGEPSGDADDAANVDHISEIEGR